MQYQMEPDNADNYAKHYESFGVYTQFFSSQFACDDAHTELIAYKNTVSTDRSNYNWSLQLHLAYSADSADQCSDIMQPYITPSVAEARWVGSQLHSSVKSHRKDLWNQSINKLPASAQSF